ncbi:MAG: DoxX family membrane protein, partial [Planctomycetota bacterium]
GNGWPREWQPQTMAWVAGITELLGGGLLLLGLFSRLWGLGLTIAMGFAFYLTSWPAPVEPNLFDLATDLELYKQVYVQLALLVLAFGVCLTGPGPLSVDRLFFGRRSSYEAPTE